MFEKVKEIIADQLSVDAEGITLETTFQEDLGADSLDLFQMIMALEEEFGVEISNDEVEKLSTVGDIIAYVEKLKN